MLDGSLKQNTKKTHRNLTCTHILPPLLHFFNLLPTSFTHKQPPKKRTMSFAIDPLSPSNHTLPHCNKFFPTNLQTTNFKQLFLLQTTTNPHTHKLFHKCFVFCHHGHHPAILNQMPLVPPQFSSPKPNEVLKFEPPCLSHLTEGLLTQDLCPNAAPLQFNARSSVKKP